MKVAVVGLMQSGKSTLISAVSGRAAGGSSHVEEVIVPVADERVDWLYEHYKPKKKVYATVDCLDLPGLSFIDEHGRAAARRLFGQVRMVDMFVVVVRAFEDEHIPHPEGSVDAVRDLTALEFEFLISDLGVVERRLERLCHDLDRKGGYPDRPKDQSEYEILTRIKTGLENEVPIRAMQFSENENKILRGFRFLTAKPELIALNVGDDGSENPADFAFRDGLLLLLRVVKFTKTCRAFLLAF